MAFRSGGSCRGGLTLTLPTCMACAVAGRRRRPPTAAWSSATACRPRSHRPATAAAPSAGLAAALRHKEELLDFQRNSAQRTRVLDSGEDLTAEAQSVWLSNEEHRVAVAAAARRNAEITARRATSRVALDFSPNGDVRIVDEDATAERAAHARMHEAALSSGTASMAPRTAAAMPAPLPPLVRERAVAAAAAAAAAAAEAPSWQALPAGTGLFANPTLHGRAAAIYAGLRASLAANGGATT